MRKSTQSAFTLVELMIIVAILADLIIIALPSFLRSRNLAQNTKFISDLRTCEGAFQMYAAENNKYPATAAASVVPTGMSQYLAGFPYTSLNSISGKWGWNYDSTTKQANIHVTFANAMDDLRMQDIDVRIDNGILTTGQFRKATTTAYDFYVEN